ncbi:MAG TPA: leucyl aminopeptidase [Micromonosporaceae bacterium]
MLVVLNIRLSDRPLTTAPPVLVLPVSSGATSTIVDVSVDLDHELRSEVDAFLADVEHSGKPGAISSLPRPLRTPRRIILVGVGNDGGDECGWRLAGAAVAKAAGRDTALTIAAPSAPDPIRGLAEGLWLASYRFRLTAPRKPATDSLIDTTPDDELHHVTLLVDDADAVAEAVEQAYTIGTATRLARDLTNMPSEEKTPAWFAAQVSAIAAGNQRLSVRMRTGDDLAGFGGINAVGGGSDRDPALVELSWQPPDPIAHVVLVGKGITFDTGGISIKSTGGMALMRKDMGGAAAVMAATLGAAQLRLPVRVTALAPLAENMASGSAYRPGDVVSHYGGRTSEILNTDAEGRIVLGDALAYADAELAPDYLIDLATLTGANSVALGKRTGALFSDNDELATSIEAAAAEAGERVWRMPLTDEYLANLRSDIADLANVSFTGGAGAVVAALFLREFTGASRTNWAHIDMSAPSWAGSGDGELVKGATGWGVRTLIRWLAAL